MTQLEGTESKFVVDEITIPLGNNGATICVAWRRQILFLVPDFRGSRLMVRTFWWR